MADDFMGPLEALAKLLGAGPALGESATPDVIMARIQAALPEALRERTDVDQMGVGRRPYVKPAVKGAGQAGPRMPWESPRNQLDNQQTAEVLGDLFMEQGRPMEGKAIDSYVPPDGWMGPKGDTMSTQTVRRIQDATDGLYARNEANNFNEAVHSQQGFAPGGVEPAWVPSQAGVASQVNRNATLGRGNGLRTDAVRGESFADPHGVWEPRHAKEMESIFWKATNAMETPPVRGIAPPDRAAWQAIVDYLRKGKAP